MVAERGQLRDLVAPRWFAVSLEHIGVDVYEVSPRAPRRHQGHGDIAVAVEAAGIADVGVIIGDGETVVQLGPTDALQLYREGFPRLHALWAYIDEAPLHVVRSLGQQPLPLHQPYRVPAPKVIGDLDGGP